MALSFPNPASFISEVYLKRYSPITQNVDVSLIFPYVETYQVTNIMPVLGSKLYQRLALGIAANNLTANEIELLEIVRQMLVWGSTSMCIPFLSIQLRNKGVMRQGGENTETANLDEIRYLRHEANNLAEFYGKRLNEYLCKNGNLFPEYSNPECPVSPMDSQWDSGLYLGIENYTFDDREDLIRRFRKYFY